MSEFSLGQKVRVVSTPDHVEFEGPDGQFFYAYGFRASDLEAAE